MEVEPRARRRAGFNETLKQTRRESHTQSHVEFPSPLFSGGPYYGTRVRLPLSLYLSPRPCKSRISLPARDATRNSPTRNEDEREHRGEMMFIGLTHIVEICGGDRYPATSFLGLSIVARVYITNVT